MLSIGGRRVLLTLLLVQKLVILQVEPHSGEGYAVFNNRATLLQDEIRNPDPAEVDSIFRRKAPRVKEEDEYDEFVELVRRWRVEVFYPGKDLTNLINFVTTNVLGRMLAKFESEFTRLKVDSVSRPMLKTYVSLREATPDEISRLSKLRGARNAANHCRDLLAERDDKFRQSFGATSSEEYKKLLKLHKILWFQDRYHLAYLVFNYNLNLFKLENFLLLCNRLELDGETRKAFASYVPLL